MDLLKSPSRLATISMVHMMSEYERPAKKEVRSLVSVSSLHFIANLVLTDLASHMIEQENFSAADLDEMGM